VVTVQAPNELDGAFEAMTKQKADAVVVQSLFFSDSIAGLAIKYRLPSAAVLRSYADAGDSCHTARTYPHVSIHGGVCSKNIAGR
jgi:hypothetical protein